jgi:hypothetical protein
MTTNQYEGFLSPSKKQFYPFALLKKTMEYTRKILCDPIIISRVKREAIYKRGI